jgi:uncharacterized protein (DUF885 family)
LSLAPEAVFQQYMSELFSDEPTFASELGLTQYDSELGDVSAAAFERRGRANRAWAERLAELGWAAPGAANAGLSGEDVIDARLLASHLAGVEVMDSWQEWRRNPEVYLDRCLQGVANLFLHRLRPEPELIEAAVTRLRQVPSVLELGKVQLDPELACSVVVERCVGAARGGADFFTDVLPGEVADEVLRARLAEAAAPAASALVEFSLHLEQLAAQAKGSWAIGEDRYSALLRQRELLDRDAAGLQEVGRGAWASLDREMTDLARRVDPQATGWKAVREALNEHHPASPDELVVAYQDACGRARDFLVEHELVTFPEGEHCSVEPSPEFLRPVLAVACYFAPPPFAPGFHGHFFVPFPPNGSGQQDVEELLADNSWSAVPTIAVHEAYPGHHWQLAWSKQTPRGLRNVLTTSYFIEGWALYAEAMMRRQGFFAAPEDQLSHLEARIFRAARVVVDTSLHCGEMNFDQAVEYMIEHSSITRAVAVSEVRRYCAWPTQAASYLTGALELDRMAQRWLDDGRGNLRQFHDRVASSPGLPLALAEEELFATTG